MIVRTTCLPMLRAFSPLYPKAPLKTLGPAAVAAVGQHATVKLPKLPVPKLDNTIEKFLRSVHPLLDEIEFERSRKIACDFALSEGLKLQEQLEDLAACVPNWLEDLWLKTAYLGYREPVVINSSPSLMLPSQQFHSETDRLVFTAKLIYGALQFHGKVYRHEIPTQMVGNVPQDMTQFYRIFGTVRKPALPIDNIIFSDIDQQPQHICVVHNNHFFKLHVKDNHNNPLGEDQILFMLKHVVENTSEKGPPIGVLTTLDRDSWAHAYKLLNCPTLKDNSCSLSTIESCLFLVCLDIRMPQGNSDKRTAICRQLLHGGGVLYNSGNRWFDKCIQFIVGVDGEVGLCYEHTPAEAIPVSIMVDDILKHVSTSKIVLSDEIQCPRPAPLPFQVNPAIDCEIQKARESLNVRIRNLDLVVLDFESYGKNVIKSFKLSPDSYIQMAMQLAFMRLHGHAPATYESASTRMFEGGRTETIRSCSIESKKFCKVMGEVRSSSDPAKVDALRLAVEKHKEYTNEAMRGLGVDRHLLGLKLMCKTGSHGKLPEFFRDTAYVRSTKFLISSSQVGAAEGCVMSYGPSEVDGYGVCYNPLPNRIIVAISSFHHCPSTDSSKYADALEKSFLDMEKVMTAKEHMKSKL